jgi:hypothetical protein
VKRGQKRLKNAKKMDFSKTKTDIYKQKNMFPKNPLRYGFYQCDKIKKKKNFDFG